MFYSHFLLSRKGHLGAIWLAAYCFKLLKKKQVAETDIPSSVDKIIVDEMPSLTYRILASLLLGVVRIYSMKVEYLFHDCHEIIGDMDKYFGKQKISLKKPTRAPQFSVRLPMRYELDAFVLEVADYPSGDNVAQCEDIVLQEIRLDDGVGVSLEKFDELAVHLESHCSAQPSAEAAVQNETCTSQAPVQFSADQGNDSSTHTPPDEVLFSPPRFEPDEVATSQLNKRSLGESIEELREVRFSHKECIDFEMFCQANTGDPDIQIPSFGPQNPASECLDSIEEEPSESHDAVELKEVASTSHDYDARELKEVALTSKRTPGSVVQDTKGGDAPTSLAIRTPANKERGRVKGPAKRKCIHDCVIVLSNRALKKNIDCASDLVRKQRKVPHTSLDLGRFSHVPYLAQNFLKPIIPGIVLEQIDSYCRKKRKIMEPVETAQGPSTPGENMSPRSPDNRSAIAPGTPVLYSTSDRFSWVPESVDSDREGQAYSPEGARHDEVATNDVNSVEVATHETNLMDEEPEQYEGDGKKPYVWTAKTRAVASYLRRSIMHQKQRKGEEAVQLSHLLRGKRKRESARLFYEILVLKCGGFVDLKQKRPFADILVRETDRMEETLGKC
ncbi:hypothetical protein Dimus_013238 [Dionaea muscipula]